MITNVKIFDNIKIMHDEFGCTSARGMNDRALKKEAKASIQLRHIDPAQADDRREDPSFLGRIEKQHVLDL